MVDPLNATPRKQLPPEMANYPIILRKEARHDESTAYRVLPYVSLAGLILWWLSGLPTGEPYFVFGVLLLLVTFMVALGHDDVRQLEINETGFTLYFSDHPKKSRTFLWADLTKIELKERYRQRVEIVIFSRRQNYPLKEYFGQNIGEIFYLLRLHLALHAD